MLRLRKLRWVATLLRAFVLALVLPLASAGALPAWASLVGIEASHVCRCSSEKHDCLCPKCNPDHEEDSVLASESLTGRCGDDDVAFGGKALGAVLPPSSVLTPEAIRTTIASPSVRASTDFSRPPPTPPPRSSSTAV